MSIANKEKYNLEPFKGHSEKGIFNFRAWQEEADAHLLSAKMLYDIAEKRKAELKERFSDNVLNGDRKAFFELVRVIESTGKSCLLLLGYAIETYLKSGLVRLFQLVTREDFQLILKRNYGHRLKKAVTDLDILLTSSQLLQLDRITKLVLDEARYPVTPRNQAQYIEATNRVNGEIWSSETFQKWSEIAEIIKAHVVKIDSDRNNPASFESYSMGKTGYFVFRHGGNLPSYLIAKFCKETTNDGIQDFEEIKSRISENYPDKIMTKLILSNWENCKHIDINKITK